MLIYVNFNFAFLGLDNVYFHWNIYCSFFKPFKTLAVRAFPSIKHFVSCFTSDKALLLVF